MSAEITSAGRPGAHLLRLDGRDQSIVDLDDPTRIDFDYMRRMADVIDAAAPAGEPMRIIHVGGAAMTLPRYVATTRPRSAQVVLEPDTAMTDLVRAELPLPRRSGIKVRPVDGRTGLDAFGDDWADLVLIDAFADGQVPADLVTTECAALVRRVLRPDGLLLANLTDRAPFGWARRAIAAYRSVLTHAMLSAEPATLRARRAGNLLLVASDAPVPLTTLRARAATSPAPYKILDGGQVSDSFGGGTPFTDLDTEPSPKG